MFRASTPVESFCEVVKTVGMVFAYFGEPVYLYSLKEGINDGFLTPFKVKRIKTTLDDYIYTPDDHIIEGEIEEGRLYEEANFNNIIEIKVERLAKNILKYRASCPHHLHHPYGTHQ
jgi:type I site-specific restriction endonuclease